MTLGAVSRVPASSGDVHRLHGPNRRRSPAGERIRSFTIITTPPNELCAALHNRMPVVLAPEAWPAWLGEEPADEAHLKALLAPYPADGMACWPVNPRVGNKNNDPGLVDPINLP